MNSGWNCDCGMSGITDIECPECGRTQAKNIYNRLLVQKLYGEVGDGSVRNIDIIQRYAYGLAKKRNVPLYLVDDVVSEAILAIVANIEKFEFDGSRGKFSTWAITIVRNTMSRMAGKDAAYNNQIEISVDYVGPDGELVEEAIAGDELTVDTAFNEEDAMYEMMQALARRALGYVTVIDDSGKEQEVQLYDLCLKAYETTEGRGWMALAASMAGMTRQAFSRRRQKMQEEWERWSEE